MPGNETIVWFVIRIMWNLYVRWCSYVCAQYRCSVDGGVRIGIGENVYQCSCEGEEVRYTHNL